MNREKMTTTTLYILGLLHLLLASVLLYFVVDPARSPANGTVVKILTMMLAGLGGGVGVALIWKSGRVTWRSDQAMPSDKERHE